MNVIVVNFYLHNRTDEVVLRFCTRSFSNKVNGNVEKFFIGIQVPIQFGLKISAEQYGVRLRGDGSVSDIVFGLTETLWNYVTLHWKGRIVEIIEGDEYGDCNDFTTLFKGRVSDLGFDFNKSQVVVKISDESSILNVPFITDLYRSVPGILDIESLSGVLDKVISGDTVLTQVECTSPGIVFTGNLFTNTSITFPAGFTGVVQLVNNTSGGWTLSCGLSYGTRVSIVSGSGAAIFCDGSGFILADNSESQAVLTSVIGKPKPRLWGQGFSLSPILEYDGVFNQTWRLSTRSLAEISNISVGGIPWREVTTVPVSGEWKANLVAGTFVLGATTLGSEVRCDAKAVGWETLTTGELLKEIVQEKGYEIAQDHIDALNIVAPYLIGLFTDITSVNLLDVLDLVMSNVAGWWTFGFEGKFQAGIIMTPEVDESIVEYNEVNIMSLVLSSIDPPAWRIRVRFKPNWNTLSSPLLGVGQAEAFVLKEKGLIAEAYLNTPILNIEPQAVDVPIIESFVIQETEAKEIRDRIAAAWSVERRIYDLVLFGDRIPEIYDTIRVRYKMLDGYYRVHSVMKSKEGGNHTIQIWG